MLSKTKKKKQFRLDSEFVNTEKLHQVYKNNNVQIFFYPNVCSSSGQLAEIPVYPK